MRYAEKNRQRWLTAVSPMRWRVTVTALSGAIIMAIVFVAYGAAFIQGKLRKGESAFSLGFGKLDSRALIVWELPERGTRALTVDVLLANLPQLVCSMLYFAYNSLFTGMLLAQEYAQYAMSDRHKALRVSEPKGKQSMLRYGCDFLVIHPKLNVHGLTHGSSHRIKLLPPPPLPLLPALHRRIRRPALAHLAKHLPRPDRRHPAPSPARGIAPGILVRAHARHYSARARLGGPGARIGVSKVAGFWDTRREVL